MTDRVASMAEDGHKVVVHLIRDGEEDKGGRNQVYEERCGGMCP